ncbi:hypothetical protein TrST_g471 [Triparma strigata]|uniref:EF-hand domain-containing protein n=1 Tax=Triparma strigata TaxID=1606541 RepID=A0A9W7F222_9STRA|nr:hypothetical protein TrST_g471 [Triparma strigata]
MPTKRMLSSGASSRGGLGGTMHGKFRDSTMRTPRPKSHRVDLDRVLEFLFPAGFQHPLVAGRLIAYGMYGPLDDNLCLHSGEKGMHVVQGYELNAMCDQFEKEDIMQVYISKNRPLASLNPAEKAEMLEGAHRSTKTTHGKLSSQMSNSQMPAFSQEQIVEMFKPLERDEDGLISFHDMQQEIVKFRHDRIRMLREMDIHGKIKDPPSWILIETDPQLKATKMREKYSIELSDEMKRTKNIANRKLGGPGRGRSLVSNYVAPPTMFIKNEGFTPNEAAGATNKLLSTRVYKMANLGPDMHDPGLVQNVYLMRQPAGRERKDVAPWAQIYK